MLTREYVQTCVRCAEVTPHSHRIVAWPWIAAGTCVAGAAWSLFHGLGGWILAAALAYVGMYLVLRDRERCWRTRCERCRWKQVAAIRKAKVKLDGRTEIFFL